MRGLAATYTELKFFLDTCQGDLRIAYWLANLSPTPHPAESAFRLRAGYQGFGNVTSRLQECEGDFDEGLARSM